MAKNPMDDRKLDKRVLHRYVERGDLTEKEVAKYLKDLPDRKEASEHLDLEETEPGGNGEATEGAPN
jgi:hypothetical protein